MNGKVASRARWLGWLCATLVGCSNTVPPLDEARREELLQLTGQVEQPRMMSMVERLVESHLKDTPIDCHQWGPNIIERFCRLSRDTAPDLIEQSLRESGLEVRRQFMPGEEHDVTNLVADIPGTVHPEEVVVVGAHFDAFWGGADDNASGVAGMLELARVLSKYRFERTIRFVAFDLEEFGAVGSSRFAAETVPGEKRVATVIFDCIAFASDEPGSQLSMPGLPSPEKGDFLAVVGNDHSAALASQMLRINQGLGLVPLVPMISPGDGLNPLGEPLLRSDHASFWSASEPALLLTDTALFRNPHYHEPTDLTDTLDPEFFTHSVRLALASVATWAGGPR